MNLSWENQQQLIGDQASLDYVLSCSNRLNTNTNNDLNSILNRTGHITKVFINFINKKKTILNFSLSFQINYMNYILMKKNV
jgi:hypothetical protein